MASADLSAREVADKIGLGDTDPVSLGVVIPVTDYWGREPADIWNWIDKQRREA